MTSTTLSETLEFAGVVMALAIVPVLPLELLWHWRRGTLTASRGREMVASASPAVPTLLLYGTATTFILFLYGRASAYAPWQLPVTWWSAALAVLLADFLYYWDHRAGHRIRLYWAIAHSVHHSSPQYDQTTGLRVSFVDSFISPFFYLPLVLLGFHPLLVAAALGIIIGYQQWLHTELVGRLPWLDGWLNTPANHRVHHGVQARYHDKNFGAVLMVWDRLFGTYAREVEPVRYGVTKPIDSVNPITVHVHEARLLWSDLKASTSMREALRRLLNGPEWQPSRASGRPQVPGSVVRSDDATTDAATTRDLC